MVDLVRVSNGTNKEKFVFASTKYRLNKGDHKDTPIMKLIMQIANCFH